LASFTGTGKEFGLPQGFLPMHRAEHQHILPMADGHMLRKQIEHGVHPHHEKIPKENPLEISRKGENI